MPSERSLPLGKRLGYALQGGVLRLVVALSLAVGIDRASAGGAWVGRRVLAPLLGARGIVAETLSVAFPAMTSTRRSEIAAAMWENLGRVAAELAFIDRLDATELARRVTVTGLDNLAAAQSRGKGVLLISGHFGNWELVMPVVCRLLGHRLAIVVRTPSNPYVAPWITHTRDASGITEQIDRGAAPARRMMATLRRGDLLMLLADQHVDDGFPVPLFGRMARTTPTPATFARKLGTPIVPFVFRRRIGATFELEILPEIAVPQSANPDHDALEATVAINAMLEAEIRRNPGHWLWGHRRWRQDDGALSRRAERATGESGPQV